MKLELDGLTKNYKDKVALDHISFSFTPGIYGLLGPNGAGKSTMMNLITDNLVPTGGRVLLDGKSIGELTSEEDITLEVRMVYLNEDDVTYNIYNFEIPLSVYFDEK